MFSSKTTALICFLALYFPALLHAESPPETALPEVVQKIAATPVDSLNAVLGELSSDQYSELQKHTRAWYLGERARARNRFARCSVSEYPEARETYRSRCDELARKYEIILKYQAFSKLETPVEEHGPEGPADGADAVKSTKSIEQTPAAIKTTSKFHPVATQRIARLQFCLSL